MLDSNTNYFFFLWINVTFQTRLVCWIGSAWNKKTSLSIRVQTVIRLIHQRKTKVTLGREVFFAWVYNSDINNQKFKMYWNHNKIILRVF